MKNSIQSLTPVYNTDRMVQDYTNRYYVPTSERFERFSNNEAEIALRAADYKCYMTEHWPYVRFVGIHDQVERLDDGMQTMKAVIHTGVIPANQVKVEVIYYEEQAGGEWLPIVVPLALHLPG